MKRIDITYGGQLYSVGNREVEDLQREIAAAMSSTGSWLEVNSGEGAPRPSFLFLAPGADIALTPIPDESPAPADD